MARRDERYSSRSSGSRSRNTSTRSRDRDYRDDRPTDYRGRGKSESEARVERVTWAALVVIFAVLQLLPEETAIPNWAVPAAGALILFGSGIYQYTKRWRVGAMTWIGGTVMALLAFYSFEMNPFFETLPIALIVFAVVILVGVLTNET